MKSVSLTFLQRFSFLIIIMRDTVLSVVHGISLKHVVSFCCLMTVSGLLANTMRDENEHSMHHKSTKVVDDTESPVVCRNTSSSVLCGVFQTSLDWQSWSPEPCCGLAASAYADSICLCKSHDSGQLWANLNLCV